MSEQRVELRYFFRMLTHYVRSLVLIIFSCKRLGALFENDRKCRAVNHTYANAEAIDNCRMSNFFTVLLFVTLGLLKTELLR